MCHRWTPSVTLVLTLMISFRFLLQLTRCMPKHPRSCWLSFAGRLTATLQIDQGHDDACPDPFVVWLVVRQAHEGEQVFSQGHKLRLRQADRGPLERDLSSFPCFLGHTCRGNIGPCGLKHDTEKISELKRGSLVAGWLNVRWSVHPFDLAPRKAAVLRNLNQPGLFEFGQVVVDPVRCHTGPLCQFFGGLGSPPQTFEQANPHGVRQCSMYRSQPRVLMLRHILYYIPISEQKSSKRDGRASSKGYRYVSCHQPQSN